MSTSAFTEEELLALLRDGSVTPEAIASEMLDAGATPWPPEALAAARGLLADLAAADPAKVATLPPGLRTLVVDEAIATKSTALVAALLAHPDKAVAKEGKRAAHSLRTRGCVVELPKAAPAPAAAPPVDDEKAAWMSMPDGFGERILFLAMPARGGVDVAEVVVSDEFGVMAARLAQLGRKEFRKFVQSLPRTGRFLMAGAPRPYVRALVSAALQQNDRAGRPVPHEFNAVSFALGPAAPRTPSPGRTLPPPDDVDAIAAQSRALVELEEFKGWLPAEAALRTLAVRLDEIAASSLYLDEAQREASREAALADAVQGYWSAARRTQAAERLFDAAWLLRETGFAEPARLALGAAAALDSDRPLEAVTFCRALFEKVVGQLRSESAVGRAPAASGLVLP